VPQALKSILSFCIFRLEDRVIGIKGKVLTLILCVMALTSVFCVFASADYSYTVVKGDSMWRIAVKHRVGLDEIKRANPDIKNPDLIYPGQVLMIPSQDEGALAFEDEVVRLVNRHRAAAGLKPLANNWQLARVARYKSQDMKDKGYFAHNSPTYGTPFQMIKNFGISYRAAGENIAKGQSSPKAVVDAWMNSSGHRANILNPSFTEIGVGYVSEGRYWTQMFIGK
jgi:uncharacterized YkwD family protein/spore coat assembly protein SafA